MARSCAINGGHGNRLDAVSAVLLQLDGRRDAVMPNRKFQFSSGEVHSAAPVP